MKTSPPSHRISLSNGENIHFVPGRGKTIIVDTEKYPNSTFALGNRVSLNSAQYNIVGIEYLANLTYPLETLSTYIVLLIKEIRDEEKASDEER